MGTPRASDVYRHASAGVSRDYGFFGGGEGGRLKFKGAQTRDKGGFRKFSRRLATFSFSIFYSLQWH